MKIRILNKKPITLAFIVAALFARGVQAQTAIIDIHPDQYGAKVSPALHGAFFEEISHGGEGGLYAELIQNRGFEDAQVPKGDTVRNGLLIPPRTPHYMLGGDKVSDWTMPWTVKSDYPGWSLVKEDGDAGLAISADHPLNSATPHNMQVTVLKGGKKVGIQNGGFWGINVQQGETYLLSFYARTDGQYHGNATASLVAKDGRILAARAFRLSAKNGWVKYSAELTAAATDTKAVFQLTFDKKGTLRIDFVSLFPKHTFNGRPNGLRADLAQKIADLKPAFLRWPGGCFVEGVNIQSAPNWKETIGPVEQRPHTFSPWDYYTSNGFGYDEYLRYCEDIGAKALFVFNVGISCEFRSGTFVPDDSIGFYIQNALDAIEYAIGPTTSKWGQIRAQNGHPKPYPLAYVEVGNEQYGPRYAKRYNHFYNAIHQQYPQIGIIASMGIGDINKNTLDNMQHVQFADEHSYKAALWSLNNDDHFDKYPRNKGWNAYVGEYATNSGVGRGNMTAALSDAVYILGMERNSDLIKMSSYAPLLVNVNDEDWPVNLINFDNAQSFGRISYYLLKMMNENRADVNIKSNLLLKLPDTKNTALYNGGVGLATWDTQSEYKDLTIEENGQVTYRSDFVNRSSEWKKLRGVWQLQDSALVQVANGPQTFAYLTGHEFSSYTLKVKARKLDGFNGFIIPFAVKDDNTFLRAHIGGWVNAVSMFETVTHGFDVANLNSPVGLPSKIEKNKWYDITLQVMGDSLACYLDGKLLMSYREPKKFFALAGKDEARGEVVVKLINAYAQPFKTIIQLNGKPVVDSATLITLTAPDGNAENTFEHPEQFVPVTYKINFGTEGAAGVELVPYSINVIRMKQSK